MALRFLPYMTPLLTRTSMAKIMKAEKLMKFTQWMTMIILRQTFHMMMKVTGTLNKRQSFIIQINIIDDIEITMRRRQNK